VVLANGDELSCDRIVSTTDPTRTLLSLVDPAWLDPELLHAATHIKYRGCTALLFYALDTLPTAPGLGNDEWSSVVSLSRSMQDIERSYDAVKYGQPSPAPHVELSAPSLRWPSLAAKGHVVVARAQYVPGDFTDREGFGDVVTRVIDEAIPGFTHRVKHRRVMLPRDLASELALTDGALTHGEILLDQILFMRPLPGLSRYATPISGLFLGGAGSNPGPGLPGAAGWLAARAALS
jgi:phytoene dehydrogenase-like protein